MPDSDAFGSKRVAVITGSGRGIGKAAAIEFAKAGYCVMINDFEKVEKLESTCREISKIIGDDENRQVACVVGDISQENVTKNLMKRTIKKFGKINVLVNNAEIADKASTRNIKEIPTTVTKSSYEQISPYFTLEEYEMADTNLRGAYLCIREATKQMILTQEQGDNN